MQQEQHTDQRDYAALLKQGFLEGRDGSMDQLGAIIGCHNLNPGRQTRLELCQFLLYPINDIECVLSTASHHYACGHLPLTIQLGQPSPLIGCEFDTRHIRNADRRAIDLLNHQFTQILHVA